MKAILLVALGGAVGSVARYKLSGLVLHQTVDWRFPAGTFAVNVIGCLAAGVLAGLAEKHDMLSPDARLLLFTGLLGGFTTFSSFGLDTFTLAEGGRAGTAAVNVAIQVVAGCALVAAGYAAGARVQ